MSGHLQLNHWFESLDSTDNIPVIEKMVQHCSLFFMIFRYKEKRWDPKRLVGSGGMPSSHSSTVTALAMAVGFSEGFGSSFFATAVILAAVVSTS